MGPMFILQFLILTAVVTGAIIFFLHHFLVASTDGAVKRLNSETETVRAKQAELNKKIKEADEELERRKKEADDLLKKMKSEAEEGAKIERDKLVKKARTDSEEIIAQAQSTKEQIRKDIQREVELKMIDFCAKIISAVLSGKAKEALNRQLIDEFLEGLEGVDMKQVGAEVTTVDVITVIPLDEPLKERFLKLFKAKIGRDMKINPTIDAAIAGGVSLRFGSLALDGSLQSTLKEAAVALKQKIEGE